MGRTKKEQVAPSWGAGSEFKFIDGLGDHREAYAVYHSPRQWLEIYIRAHQSSPHSHHKAGVRYAQDKLEALNRG